MGVYVIAKDAGGYSAYGGCSYNPRERRVEMEVQQNEVLDVTIEFTQAPSEFNYFERGIASSEPTIEGNCVVLQFQEFSSCGEYKIDVMFNGGSVRSVLFRAHDDQSYYCCVSTPDDEPTDDEDLDGGLVG